MAFTLTSPAFVDGNVIPSQFTCDGNDAPPTLLVAGVPEGTQSFALVMDDPDAPNGTFTHWLAYDIPAGAGVSAAAGAARGTAERTELPATAGKTLPNSFGKTGYGGPCPPPGHGSHRYYFTVYALGVQAIDLPGNSRDDLEAAVLAHTLAKARLMGRYERG